MEARNIIGSTVGAALIYGALHYIDVPAVNNFLAATDPVVINALRHLERKSSSQDKLIPIDSTNGSDIELTASQAEGVGSPVEVQITNQMEGVASSTTGCGNVVIDHDAGENYVFWQEHIKITGTSKDKQYAIDTAKADELLCDFGVNDAIVDIYWDPEFLRREDSPGWTFWSPAPGNKQYNILLDCQSRLMQKARNKADRPAFNTSPDERTCGVILQHELGHVVIQGGGSISGVINPSRASYDRKEDYADMVVVQSGEKYNDIVSQFGSDKRPPESEEVIAGSASADCDNSIQVVEGNGEARYEIDTDKLNGLFCDNGVSGLNLTISWESFNMPPLNHAAGRAFGTDPNKNANISIDCSPETIERQRLFPDNGAPNDSPDIDICNAGIVLHEAAHIIDYYTGQGPLDTLNPENDQAVYDNKFGPGSSGNVEDFANQFAREKYPDYQLLK